MTDEQKLSAFPALLKQSVGEIERALPKHMSADRMTRIALTAFRNTPKLAECEPRSIVAGVIMSAQLGLEIGIGGQAYLIPYFNGKTKRMECQFIPGWQGLVDLVSRAGRATVWTAAVFEGDEFDWGKGDKPFVSHKPLGDEDPAKLTHVYAVGRVQGAEWPIVEVWTIQKVKAHRDRYVKEKDRQYHYSGNNWEMYGRKVALLQVLKYVPKSVELQTAIALDHSQDGKQGLRDPFEVIEGTWAPVADEDVPDVPEKEPRGGKHTSPEDATSRLRSAVDNTPPAGAAGAPKTTTRRARGGTVE